MLFTPGKRLLLSVPDKDYFANGGTPRDLSLLAAGESHSYTWLSVILMELRYKLCRRQLIDIIKVPVAPEKSNKT